MSNSPRARCGGKTCPESPSRAVRKPHSGPEPGEVSRQAVRARRRRHVARPAERRTPAPAPQHPDDYDAGMIEQFAKLVERLDPATDERSAIVDCHDNRAAILFVRHSYFG